MKVRLLWQVNLPVGCHYVPQVNLFVSPVFIKVPQDLFKVVALRQCGMFALDAYVGLNMHPMKNFSFWRISSP